MKTALTLLTFAVSLSASAADSFPKKMTVLFSPQGPEAVLTLERLEATDFEPSQRAVEDCANGTPRFFAYVKERNVRLMIGDQPYKLVTGTMAGDISVISCEPLPELHAKNIRFVGLTFRHERNNDVVLQLFMYLQSGRVRAEFGQQELMGRIVEYH